MAIPTPVSSVPVRTLDRKHPDFARNLEMRENLRLLFEGGDQLRQSAERVLTQRPREDTDVYAARCSRLTYDNILSTGIKWYTSAMFANPPQIRFWRKGEVGRAESTDSTLKYVRSQFMNNCDLVGTPFTDFYCSAFELALVQGGAHVLIDLPRRDPNEEVVSLALERERGYLDPHLVLYSPQSLINWSKDEYGNYQWVVVKSRRYFQTDVAAEQQIITEWFLYDQETFAVYRLVGRADTLMVNEEFSDQRAELVAYGQHALASKGRVPLVTLSLMKGLWLASQVYLQLIDHINQDNTLGWALFMSNLAIPVIIGDVDTTNMVASEAGHLQFPAGTQYSWSEPDGKSFAHSANRLESLKDEIYRSMQLQSQGRSMRATPAMQSGRSKVVEMRPTQDVMTGMGLDLRRSMTETMQLVCDASRHATDVDVSVEGFVFAEELTTEEVFAANALVSMRIPSDTFERFLYRNVVQHVMRTATDAERNKAFEEIRTGKLFEERMEEDRKRRLEDAAAGVKNALANRSMPAMKPGRGSADRSPRPGGQPQGKK